MEDITIKLSSEETINTELKDIEYIPGYKEAETQRRANEVIRQENEEKREEYFANLKNAVDNGDYNTTVTLGEVTTGEAGSSASITNSGTKKDMILNFSIPKGDKGDTGLTAYESAKLGGYTKEESEFYSDLAYIQTLSNELSTLATVSEASE